MTNDELPDETDPAWADAAEDALEAGAYEEALGILADAPPDHGLRWLLSCGVWIEVDRLDRAAEDLARAEHLLGDGDPEVLRTKARLAIAHWEFDEAAHWMGYLDPEEWGAQLLVDSAFLADANGDHDRAHALLAEAHRLEPEHHPAPLRLTPEAFEAVVERAARELPEELADVFEEVAVVIDPMPTRAVVGPEHPPDLLGLFAGPPIAERAAGAGGELPPIIFLFQRNLERIAEDEESLVREIHTTLFHELGHALGFDEDGVDELGLG